MQGKPHGQKMASLGTEKAGRAAAEARAARVLERAKAPHFAPTGPRTASGPPSFRTLDRLSRALLGRATQGISPFAVAETWSDWTLHLAAAPGKRLELFQHRRFSDPAAREIEDVIFHDPGRDDQDQLRKDLFGRRLVLDQLDQVVAINNLPRRDRHISSDFERLRPRGRFAGEETVEVL